MTGFELGTAAVFLAAPVTLLALTVSTAPYGRHARPGFGPALPARLGWVVMEAPAALVYASVAWVGPHRGELVPALLSAAWLAHYLHRAFVYPLRMRPSAEVPALVVAMGAAFNVVNGALNAWWVTTLAGYPGSWATHPAFAAGMGTFGVGYALNRWSDAVLRDLRGSGRTGYSVPRGGPYTWVSCPNYLGELVMWAGFALAAASPAGLAFVVFTAANLGPRAASHHRWYRATFPDYPPERKALVPFVW